LPLSFCWFAETMLLSVPNIQAPPSCCQAAGGIQRRPVVRGDAERLKIRPLGKRVGNVKNDTPDLIELAAEASGVLTEAPQAGGRCAGAGEGLYDGRR
jgi:hypothetical protein